MNAVQAKHYYSWPMGLVVGMLFVIAVNAYVAYLAISTDPGSFAAHPYESGLAYEDVIEAKRALAARGWTHSVLIKRDGEGGRAKVEVLILDSRGKVVEGLSGSIALFRLSNSKADLEFELVSEESGVLSASVGSLQRGLWLSSIRLEFASERMIIEDRITLE